MKVILKQEVKNLGKEWDVVTVADGYARNFLLPRNMAMAATQTGVKDLERRRQQASVKRQQQEEVAKILAGRIETIPVVITARSGPEGRLYGSVTAGDIADYLAGHGVEIDRRRVEIAEPIRTLGEHHATVELHTGVSAHVRVQVNPEGGVAAPAVAAGTSEAGGSDAGASDAGASGGSLPDAVDASE